MQTIQPVGFRKAVSSWWETTSGPESSEGRAAELYGIHFWLAAALFVLRSTYLARESTRATCQGTLCDSKRVALLTPQLPPSLFFDGCVFCPGFWNNLWLLADSPAYVTVVSLSFAEKMSNSFALVTNPIRRFRPAICLLSLSLSPLPPRSASLLSLLF